MMQLDHGRPLGAHQESRYIKERRSNGSICDNAWEHTVPSKINQWSEKQLKVFPVASEMVNPPA